VRVHDAFLVRYTAGAQCHLPLHVDESQLSFTLALNDAFVGGGTYFASLRRALLPAIGHLIAFDGHTLHGGEPIVSGTRYIVAAFLFVGHPPQPEPLAPSRAGTLHQAFLPASCVGKRMRDEGGGGGSGSERSKASATCVEGKHSAPPPPTGSLHTEEEDTASPVNAATAVRSFSFGFGGDDM